jgi:hypothetical protein
MMSRGASKSMSPSQSRHRLFEVIEDRKVRLRQLTSLAGIIDRHGAIAREYATLQ